MKYRTNWYQKILGRTGQLVYMFPNLVIFTTKVREVVEMEEEARSMWVRLYVTKTHTLYIAICYFPPNVSRYARHEVVEQGGEEGTANNGEGCTSPYTHLSKKIEYAQIGKILNFSYGRLQCLWLWECFSSAAVAVSYPQYNGYRYTQIYSIIAGMCMFREPDAEIV